jgi:hypothetical protein
MYLWWFCLFRSTWGWYQVVRFCSIRKFWIEVRYPGRTMRSVYGRNIGHRNTAVYCENAALYTVPYYFAQDFEEIRSVYSAVWSKFTVKIRIAVSIDLGYNNHREKKDFVKNKWNISNVRISKNVGANISSTKICSWLFNELARYYL